MEDWVRQIVASKRTQFGQPLEVKDIGRHSYHFQSTIVWLKGHGKWKKTSKFFDKIIPEGVMETYHKRRSSVRNVYE